MNWLESIRLQASAGDQGATRRTLALLSGSLRRKQHPGLIRVVVGIHATIPGCFCIHLFWSTRHPEPAGSWEGQKTAQALRSHGLIEHSVWTAKES